jgi:hypothetical protein
MVPSTIDLALDPPTSLDFALDLRGAIGSGTLNTTL